MVLQEDGVPEIGAMVKKKFVGYGEYDGKVIEITKTHAIVEWSDESKTKIQLKQIARYLVLGKERKKRRYEDEENTLKEEPCPKRKQSTPAKYSPVSAFSIQESSHRPSISPTISNFLNNRKSTTLADDDFLHELVHLSPHDLDEILHLDSNKLLF
uniref:Uncharacterized protein n=1 Tax=Aureoumbra lagunensis TaxID=44058 RepID=A0A7S3K3D1_9STRA